MTITPRENLRGVIQRLEGTWSVLFRTSLIHRTELHSTRRSRQGIRYKLPRQSERLVPVRGERPGDENAH